MRDVTLLQVWAAQWRDLVEIEFVPVVSGKDTAAAFAPLLGPVSGQPDG